MRVITGGRRSGKTYKAIEYASANGLYILVATRQEATQIFQMSNEHNLPIPYPIAIDDIKSGRVKGTSLERDGIIIDNALDVLQSLLAVEIKIATI